MSRYDKCKKCGAEAVQLATSGDVEIFGDQDDNDGNDSEYADEAPPDTDTEIVVGAHVCFECGHVEDVFIEHPRENTGQGHSLIITERYRQIAVEGCTDEKDDEYEDCELYNAAWCYMMHSIVGIPDPDYLPLDWPWDKKWWKPRDQKSNLVRAGALLMAEQERLGRMVDKIAAEIEQLEELEKAVA